ncbi:unnamed protein product [Paramecium primaurelia]|uniref:Uncharacterized protein n=1 Tax=Paramecium primaurelia TaxID=5886 RepID=A0A8S1NBD1_PARPR|nr:unnamed protein product [Paramecium primaurelia]
MTNRLINRYVKDYNAEHLNQQQNFVLTDIQSNFNTKIIDNPYQQVEKVIPNNMNIQKISICIVKNQTNNLMKKQRINQKKLIGENIYKKELNFIMKEQQQEYQYFEEKQDEEEVYVDNWNNQQLSKMSQQLIQHI